MNEAETPAPARSEDEAERQRDEIERSHSRNRFCDDLDARLLVVDGRTIAVCDNCPEDPDTQLTKPPVLWREHEGVVRQRPVVG